MTLTAEEACARTAHLRTSQVFEPVPAWREALEHTYNLYLRLYPALRPLFAG